jgi:hypothetical protein
MIVDWVSWPNLHTVEGMNRPLLMASVMVAWSCALCEKGYILFKLSWNRNFESLHLWTLILGVGEGLIQSRCKGTFKRFWYREDRGHAIWWLQMSSGTDFLDEHFVLSIFRAQIARKLRFRSSK